MRSNDKKNNSSRKLMQDLEGAIRDLKEIQKQRDKLVEDFKIEKSSFNRDNSASGRS
jgi:hypothetical protein